MSSNAGESPTSPQATIRLDQALKLLSLVSSGGEAKHLIQSGAVMVGGVIETRRGHKLRAGDQIALVARPNHIFTVPPLKGE